MGADLNLLKPRLVGASVTGRSHVMAGRPCQDAFAFARSGSLRLAVADGLGSAAQAETGARLAVDAAIENDDDVVSMVEHARAALQAAAIEGDHAVAELATTLLVVRAHGTMVEAAQVGDGGIVGLDATGDLHLLCDRDPHEYVNETTPLTADDWRAALRTTGPLHDIAAVALFTDGCEHAAITADERPHPGFLLPLFEFAKGSPDPAELEKLLAGEKMSEHSDDDKTLVIAWL